MADLEESKRVVWHTPTEYNALRHGPPYLPRTPYEPVKLSSIQKAEVRAFVKNASEPGSLLAQEDAGSPLVTLLAVLQAAALVHQTHHWGTRGHAFYADHLLFERIYNESLEFIDQVAERAVGLGLNRPNGQPDISALDQLETMILVIKGTVNLTTHPEDMVNVSLGMELRCLSSIDVTLQAMQKHVTTFGRDKTEPSHGTVNLLEGIADKHETFVYLLQQRGTPVKYSYDRT